MVNQVLQPGSAFGPPLMDEIQADADMRRDQSLMVHFLTDDSITGSRFRKRS